MHPAPLPAQAHTARPVSRLPAPTLGRGRAQRLRPPPGNCSQGLPRSLSAGETRRSTPAPRSSAGRGPRTAPSPREVARWIATAPDRRGLHVRERLSRLLDHCPELQRAHTLVREFAAMLDAQDAALLPAWLDRLATSRLPALASMARSVREDEAAVVQGITTSFSSGVNEGRITDVKLQKRIMGGRAGLPLLRQRVVLIAHLRRRYPGSNPPTPP
ncbi:transposase [Streptomyces violascens]|uniref:transposase n=1 Tax=Streptomyces violascens TaxID=67381 RepID=UPI00364C70EC